VSKGKLVRDYAGGLFTLFALLMERKTLFEIAGKPSRARGYTKLKAA
jgi:hypothetical protein